MSRDNRTSTAVAYPTCNLGLILGMSVGSAVAAFSSAKALILIVALFATVVMLIKPVWAFYALVAMIPVAVDFGHGITVTRLIAPLSLLIILLNAMVKRVPWPNPFEQPAGLMAMAYFFLVYAGFVMHMFFSEMDLELASPELGGYAVRAVLFYLTLTFVRTPKDLESVARVLVVVGLVEVAIAIAQVHFRFVLPGDWRLAAAANIDLTNQGFRAEGTTAHAIFLACFLQTMLPFLVYMAFHARKAIVRGLLLLAVPFTLYAWYSTYSRSSAIGMVAMLLAAIALWSRLGRVLLGVSLIVGLLVLGAYNWSVAAVIQDIQDVAFIGDTFRKGNLYESVGAFQFRMESWAGGWNLFLHNFWGGVGSGQAIREYIAFLPPDAVSIVHPSVIHNIFLEAAAEYGVFALVLLIGFWVLAFRSLITAFSHPQLRGYAQVLFIVLVGQLFFLLMTPMVREIWFTLPLAIAIGRMAQNDKQEQSVGISQE